MRLNYRPVLIWAGIYLSAIVIFSLVYFLLWLRYPDSFLINEQINLGPVKHFEGLLSDNLPTKTSVDLAKLDGLRIAYNNAIADVSKTAKDLNDQLIVTEQQLKTRSNDNVKVMMENYNKSIDVAIKALMDKRVGLVKDVAMYDELIKDSPQDTQTYLSLEQSKKQVELSKLDYEISTTKLEAMQKGFSNLGQFADNNLSDLVAESDKKSKELRDKLSDLNARKILLQNKIREEVQKIVSDRASRLKWLDFLYFSVVTATTVGYGDIVPNSDVIRIAVMIEIVVCIFAFGLLISLLSQPKNNI